MTALLALSPVWSWTIVVLVGIVVVVYAALVAGGMADDAAEEAYRELSGEEGLEDELERIRVGAQAGTTGPAYSEPGIGEPIAPAIAWEPPSREELERSAQRLAGRAAELEGKVEIARRIVSELTRRLEVHHREIGVDPSRNGCHVCRPGGSLDLWERER